MPHDQTSVYFDAAKYACEILGHSAGKYLSRLFDLAQYNSVDELKSIVDGWANGLRIVIPDRRPGPWAVGASWGETTRIEHDKGIFWRVRCRCGKYFKISTNDSIADERRKCDNCLLADDLSAERQAVNAQLETSAAKILALHRQWDKLVWKKVRSAIHARGLVVDEEFSKELHAHVWAHVATKIDSYRDTGYTIQTWLGTVVTNCLKDYFKTIDNRERLAPMEPLPLETPDPAHTQPPAKPVRPAGAKPDEWRPEKPNRLIG